MCCQAGRLRAWSPLQRAPSLALLLPRSWLGRCWELCACGRAGWAGRRTPAGGGSLAIAEHLIPPAAESPWHVRHTQDESFYVLDGQVTVIVGNERWTLGPGDYAFGPREVPHGFRVEGQSPARLLLICTPGAGFDRFIHQGSEPATAPGFPPPQPPDVARLAQLAAEAGGELLGPLPAHLL